MLITVLAFGWLLGVQGTAPKPPQQATLPPKAPIERIGPNRLRIGTMEVDTAKREVVVMGTVNDAPVVEFVANAVKGIKAYESAITLDADAINFNVALVLIGLDRANAKPSQTHFDRNAVAGDRVAVTVEWKGENGIEKGPIERLLFDKQTNGPVAPTDWVYTGSTFTPDGQYLAHSDGTLIGFAHAPGSIIESAQGIGLGRYGTIGQNPRIKPGTRVTVRITAAPVSRGR
jgi:hypothetical protein